MDSKTAIPKDTTLVALFNLDAEGRLYKEYLEEQAQETSP